MDVVGIKKIFRDASELCFCADFWKNFCRNNIFKNQGKNTIIILLFKTICCGICTESS